MSVGDLTRPTLEERLDRAEADLRLLIATLYNSRTIIMITPDESASDRLQQLKREYADPRTRAG